MGNVLAASSQTSSLLDKTQLRPPDPLLPGVSDEVAKPSDEESESLPNPGTIEELHKKCKGK